MKTLLLALLTMGAFTLSAQDVIILRDGSEINSKVLEVGTTEVKYKAFDNPEGPVYALQKARIFMIRYENGTKDVFSEQETQEGPALPKASIQVNPLGLLQFGPIIQYETRISDKGYLVPYFRYAFAGLLTHVVWTGLGGDDYLSPASAALGLGLRNFAQPNGHSWYYSVLADLSWTTANYDVGWQYETQEKATNLALILNPGYRWRKPGGNNLSVGLLTGVGFTLKDEERYVSDGSLYGSYNDIAFFGMLELSFGWDK